MTAACQVRLIGEDKQQISGEHLACANFLNDIYLFSLEDGAIQKVFYAHDDYIKGLLFIKDKLVSYSKDMTIKIWNLAVSVKSNLYEDNPIILFDHEADIISCDILRTDEMNHLLASIDSNGIILIRNIS